MNSGESTRREPPDPNWLAVVLLFCLLALWFVAGGAMALFHHVNW